LFSVALFKGSREEADGLESLIWALMCVAIVSTLMYFPFLFYILRHPDISLYTELLRIIWLSFPIKVPEWVWVLFLSLIFVTLFFIGWFPIGFVLHMMLTSVKSASGWMTSLRKAW
jgi:hypothetical protein